MSLIVNAVALETLRKNLKSQLSHENECHETCFLETKLQRPGYWSASVSNEPSTIIRILRSEVSKVFVPKAASQPKANLKRFY